MIDPAALREEFERRGFVHVRGVFDAHWLRDLEADFDRIVAQLKDSGEPIDATWRGKERERISDGAAHTIVHTHNVQQYSATWLRALLSERFVDCAAALLGDDVVLHHSKLFFKPPKAGSPFPMHQDWTYFPAQNDSMLAAIIHVSDADDEMGCLRVVPGSHRLGRVPDSSGEVPCALLDEYPIEEAMAVEAKAGDVVFFHYFTLHGSYPNRSSRSRKTVLAQLHRGDDVIEGDHPNESLVLRGWNYTSTRASAGK